MIRWSGTTGTFVVDAGGAGYRCSKNRSSRRQPEETLNSAYLAATRSLGSLNVQTIPPWLKSLTTLATSPPQRGTAPPQPERTDTYCSPSMVQVTGVPTTPEPVLNL